MGEGKSGRKTVEESGDKELNRKGVKKRDVRDGVASLSPQHAPVHIPYFYSLKKIYLFLKI